MGIISSEVITRCERDILNTIGWDLETYPTFFSILEIFRSQGVLFDTDPGPITPATVILVDKYLDLFCLLVLQDPSLCLLNPYILSCAILAASRTVTLRFKSWPDELARLTGLQHEHFKSLTTSLVAKYKEKFVKNTGTFVVDGKENNVNNCKE